MRIFIGIDDTDTIDSNRGTGKLARWFGSALPDDCRLWGVVRQQLLVDDSIPYTSHNSAACVVVDVPDPSRINDLIDLAVSHIHEHFEPGSDPGLCVASNGKTDLSGLIEFGYTCVKQKVDQSDARQAAAIAHLSGHGGTNDGIIGAAAAVGLTASGGCGRFIEFGNLRDWPEKVRVADLNRQHIQVLSLDRDARIPCPSDWVYTRNWIRPCLMGGQPVLAVRPRTDGSWENIFEKRKKKPH